MTARHPVRRGGVSTRDKRPAPLQHEPAVVVRLNPTVENRPALLPALTACHQLPLFVQSPFEGFVDLLRSLPIVGKRLSRYRVVPHVAESAGPSDDLILRVRRCRSKGHNSRHRQKTSQLCHVKPPLVTNWPSLNNAHGKRFPFFIPVSGLRATTPFPAAPAIHRAKPVSVPAAARGAVWPVRASRQATPGRRPSAPLSGERHSLKSVEARSVP
jgi:hypothetical protein